MGTQYTLEMRLALALLLLAPGLHAQWQLQQSNTTADLRGINALGSGVAWASGSHGTVLHTIDNGTTWQVCAVPVGAEALDFRAVQAFDVKTAIVMSSGKGDLSRLYKTTDGCLTWKLVFTNLDAEGFWDALTAHISSLEDQEQCRSSLPVITGAIFGDPAIHRSNPFDKVDIPSFYLAKFTINSSCQQDSLTPSVSSLFSGPNEAAFAASNSNLFQLGPSVFFLATATQVIQYQAGFSIPIHNFTQSICGMYFHLRHGTPSQGVFSVAIRPGSTERPKARVLSLGPSCLKSDIVAVGGDYTAPDETQATAAFTGGSKKFQMSRTMPHGYRSAVAYSVEAKSWITVGPNGTDLSNDDGRNWHALTPSSGGTPGEDKGWNALSLPFAVGPHGRIGLLRQEALAR